MEHAFNPHIMLGVVAKTAVYGALLVVGGPAVAGAGVVAANAIADGVGAAVEGIESNEDLRERLMDAMRDALDESFDASAKKPADPCEFGPTVREAVRGGLLRGKGEVTAGPGADGAAALFELVSHACALCPSVSASDEAKQWLVNEFFERLQGKMLSDDLMCNLLIYRTILYGFSSMFPQLQDISTRLDRIESDIKVILSSCGPDSAAAALLKALEYLASEGIFLWGDGAEGNKIVEWLRDLLEAALAEMQAKTTQGQAPGESIKMTPIRRRGVLVGRDSELAQVDELLEKEGFVVVRGDGGIGKTSLAAALVNDHIPAHGPGSEGDYSRFAWIKSTGTLRSDLARIETKAGNGRLSLDERAEEALGWLRSTRERTLLAIDGMDAKPTDEERDALDSFSPDVKVLVTSRADLGMGEAYVLRPMDLDQSTRMFYAYFWGMSKAPALAELETEDDYPTTREIVRLCDGNALLIELIAKAARSEGGRLQDYWEERGAKVFEDEGAVLETEHARSRGEGDDTLRGHVSRLYALAGLTAHQERAMALLVQFPVGAPIYYKLRDWAGIFRDDMNQLVKLGWVERREGNYSVHQVVRESVLLQLEVSGVVVNPMDYGSLIEKTLGKNSYLDVMEGYEAITERIVVPETLERLLSKVGGEKEAQAELPLCAMLGDVHLRQGDYSKALYYGLRLIQLSVSLLGEDNPFAVEAHLLLGTLYRNKGDFNQSVEHFETAARVTRKVFGADSLMEAWANERLGTTHVMQGDKEAARKRFEMAARGFEASLGVDNPITAMVHVNIGGICRDLGDYEHALGHLERVVGPPEIPGVDDVLLRVAYANLSMIHHALQNYERSTEYLEKAERELENAPDVYDPDMSQNYGDLGRAFVKLSDFRRARECFEKAVRGLKATLGANNPITASAYADLGRTSMKMGDFERARDCLEKGVKGLEASPGADGLQAVKVYMGLGIFCIATSDFERARDCFEKLTEEHETILRKDSRNWTKAHTYLGMACYELGDYERARDCLEVGVGRHEASFEDDNAVTREAHRMLGTIYQSQCDYQHASECFKTLVKECETYLGADDPDTLRAYAHLGVACIELGDNERGEELLERARNGLEPSTEAEDFETLRGYTGFGVACLEQGYFEQAEALLDKALRGLKATLGADDPKTRDVYRFLGIARLQLGDYKRAQDCLKRSIGKVEAAPCAEDPKTYDVYIYIAISCLALGQSECGRRNYERAVRRYEAAFGPDSLQLAKATATLGNVHLGMGDHARARELLESAVGPIEAGLGGDHPETQEVYKCLGEACFALGDYERAEEWFAKVSR